MIINRVWAMPNKWTFQIKPIKKLLDRYVGDGKGWIDPFAGMYSPAEFTNDLNPKANAGCHLEALDFLKRYPERSFKGVLFDPPYGLRQMKECYESMGLKINQWGKNNTFWKDRKEQASKLLIPNGFSISFGYNTVGMGINLGFEIVEILLVCHGGLHYDTIVTVERKINKSLESYEP